MMEPLSKGRGFQARRDLGLAPDRPFFDNFDASVVPSPCFVLDKDALQYNLDVLSAVRRNSGARILAALKAFSMHSQFPAMAAALDGACASGLHEALLAREHFGSNIHVYSPAYSTAELDQLLGFASHIVFNSVRQWHLHKERCLAAAAARQQSAADLQQSAADLQQSAADLQQSAADLQQSAAGLQQSAALAPTPTPTPPLSFGIRINPEHREAEVELYDPSAPFSRLGTTRRQWDADCAELGPPEGISGLHFHVLCEQDSYALERSLVRVRQDWSDILEWPSIRWLNMGGGHHITSPAYDIPHLVGLLQRTARELNLEIILEPGEAIAVHTGILRATVLDTHKNDINLALLDVSATCHMPDTLEMPYTANIWGARPLEKIANLDFSGDRAARPPDGGSDENKLPDSQTFRLGGLSCLAGDIIGDYSFEEPLQPGSTLVFDDMAHYTMVKTTTFNGVPLPSIGTWSRSEGFKLVKTFGFQDFKSRLS